MVKWIAISISRKVPAVSYSSSLRVWDEANNLQGKHMTLPWPKPICILQLPSVIYNYEILYCLVLGDMGRVQMNKKQFTFSSHFLCKWRPFKLNFLLVICYCHLSSSVPKMMDLSLNPLHPESWWELNLHSGGNSPATHHMSRLILYPMSRLILIICK